MTQPPDTATAPRLRVALYSGIVMKKDAVSNSLLLKLRLLQRLRDAGAPIEVTAFTQGSDYDDPDIRVVPGLRALLRDHHFRDSDVHVFEYGMWYELFNALVLIDQPTLVIDHNTTPPELIVDPEVQRACAKAMFERHNLHLATRIATVSEYTRDQLLELGFDGSRITVIHLPANNAGMRRPESIMAGGPGGELRVLYVGRFVAAKGISELLATVRMLWQEGDDVVLTVAGSAQFSDPEVVAALQAEVQVESERRFHLVEGADDDEIASLYATSDVFVMPSHHEGYCVPVIEALDSGCYVIGSDAGNVPNVMGGLGTVFPTGDVSELTAALREVLSRLAEARREGTETLVPTDRGDMSLAAWCDAVGRHVAGYSHEEFDARFLEVLDAIAPEPLRGALRPVHGRVEPALRSA